ncbi:MAG: SCP2 sterol-binding domain-containing protein [Terriglobales bacterium]
MSVQSCVKLRKLTAQDGEPIEDVLQRVVYELRGLGEKAIVELRLIGGENAGVRSIYSVRLTPADAVLQTERAKSPTLVLITTAKAFHDMADGSYSPVQAYLDGELKLQGNADLAMRIIRHLGELGTEVIDCPRPPEFAGRPHLTNASYDPAGPGGGSLTVNGSDFWSNGHVKISYNQGGRTNEVNTSANLLGSLVNIRLPGVTCGVIGVIVTATDVHSGQNTPPVRYPTPCGQ